MAVSKLISTTTLSIEVQNGTDSMGDPKYTKKTFSNIKNNAAPENILEVAKAITEVLSVNTRNCYLNESSLISE